MKPQQFTEQFLQLDEENDYVLKSVPCTFLDADNYCSIYEVRPKACREFPHTDRKKFQQISLRVYHTLMQLLYTQNRMGWK